MLDTRKQIVETLKKVSSNVEYELEVESPTLPLITYKTIDDSVNLNGDTLGYSNVKYQIKIWTTNLSDLATLSESIDKELKSIGLRRTYFTELTTNNVIIGVFQYSGLTKERFMEE